MTITYWGRNAIPGILLLCLGTLGSLSAGAADVSLASPSPKATSGADKAGNSQGLVGSLDLAPNSPADAQAIAQFCEQLRSEIRALHWAIEPCEGISWKLGGLSVEGRPLIYTEFGSPSPDNTTLILSAVHGDEVTPVYFGIELARWMQEHRAEFNNAHVIVAPIVNPDGLFHRPRTRMNARGVDVNRNFMTSDWPKRALAEWKTRLHSDPRRFPGSEPRSEPETLFQEALIRRIKPQKILSIHSPLSHLDYDGPNTLSLKKFPREYVRECLKLKRKLKAVSTGFFPGSLGNFAGKELGIPTITLELPSADSKQAEVYWKRFSDGIKTMIEFVVPSYASRDTPADPRVATRVPSRIRTRIQ